MLEHLAFGDALERARATFIPDLAGAERVLIIGEGDGRFLSKLLQVNPGCQIDCLDFSSEMMMRCRERLQRARLPLQCIHLLCADAFTYTYPAQHYDAVVTLFFFDLFTEREISSLIPKLANSLKMGGAWFYADFHIPEAGTARWRSLAWLRLMYSFFRWQTGISAKRFVDPTPLFRHVGLERSKQRLLSGGLLRADLYRRSKPR